MNYWIVSPNVSNQKAEEDAWKKAIQTHGVAIMGWDSDHHLGQMFINKIQLGDIILIAQGANWQKKIFLAGKVCSKAFEQHLPDTPRTAWYRNLKGVVKKKELERLNLDFNGAAYGESNQPSAIYQLKPQNNASDKIIAAKLMEKVDEAILKADRSHLLDVLRYKKQIILQGPPGTGKTKLAEELAADLIETRSILSAKPATITNDDIKKYVHEGAALPSVTGRAIYTVKEVKASNIVLSNEEKKDASPSFTKIIFFYKDKNWDNGLQRNGFDPYEAAIAKYIYEKIEPVQASIDLGSSEQFKLIQFHPSYSYEDFVRGIVAKPNLDGDGILYDAEDKVLGCFAKLALENYQISRGGNEKSTQLLQAKTTLQKFVDHVQDELDKTPERKYQISDAVYLFDVDDKRFKYKGDNWKAHEKGLNMKFSELEKIIQAGVTQRSDIKDQSNLESLTKQHATYFFNTLEKYREFEKLHSTKFDPQDIEQQIKEKNYVLIIDEINRANLSSVLGELIYALEYRGKTVESMYTVDGSNELILPPNLYIIGTMNTADRSVGHIDYAIRRRFAFIDILPKDLAIAGTSGFHSDLFKQVSALFISNYYEYITDSNIQLQRADTLSPEFDPKDVWLGHSYFIDKTEEEGGTIQIRLQYEIRPILNEYVKDGILVGNDILQTIMNLSA